MRSLYLYVCRVRKKYLTILANIAPGTQFELGVFKTQRGNATGMTNAEKTAREKLSAPTTTLGNEYLTQRCRWWSELRYESVAV